MSFSSSFLLSLHRRRRAPTARVLVVPSQTDDARDTSSSRRHPQRLLLLLIVVVVVVIVVIKRCGRVSQSRLQCGGVFEKRHIIHFVVYTHRPLSLSIYFTHTNDKRRRDLPQNDEEPLLTFGGDFFLAPKTMTKRDKKYARAQKKRDTTPLLCLCRPYNKGKRKELTRERERERALGLWCVVLPLRWREDSSKRKKSSYSLGNVVEGGTLGPSIQSGFEETKKTCRSTLLIVLFLSAFVLLCVKKSKE